MFLNGLLDYLGTIGRALLALLAALLPRRCWNRFDNLPIDRAAAISGVLTLASGLALGAFGFMRYASRVANATVRIAERQAAGELRGEITTLAAQSISSFSIVAFLFFTPLGLFSVYLVATGILRGVAKLIDDPFGDPVLTGLDALARRIGQSTRESRARRARERREGAEVPDRLLPASDADLADYDYVVVASRRKPGWSAGVCLVTSDKWYTLGEPFDVELPQGLRTVYPLKEQKVTEVLRRGMPYELPALGSGRLPASNRR